MNDKTISIVVSAQDKITAKLSEISSKLDSFSRSTQDSMESASKSSDRFGSTLGTLGSRIRFVAETFSIYKVGQMITSFADNAVTASAELQQTNMAFQGLIGNVTQANKVFAELVKYANVTPFQSKDIVQAAQTLMGFGTAGQQTVDILKQLGDVVSIGGGSLQQLSLVTGQIFAQGKMRAQDMYQVINDGGAGLVKIMAENAGGMDKLTAQFDKGGVTAKQYFDAITEATKSGGFAFNGAQKEANTFNGRLSTLKDTVTQFGMSLLGVRISPDLGYSVQKGGLFDRMSNAILATSNFIQNGLLANLTALGQRISEVAAKVDQYLGPKLEALWNTIQTKLMPTLLNLWHQALEPLMPVIGTLLVVAIGAATDALNLLLAIVTPVLNFMVDHKFAVLGLAAAFGTLYIAMNLNAAFDAITIGFNTFRFVTIPSSIASMDMFRAAVSAPMTMGAIGIGAALIALGMVYDAAQKARKAIDDTYNAAVSDAQGEQSAISSIIASYKAGKISKAQEQKLLTGIAQPAHGFASGGYTGGGNAGDIAGIVHKGEYVIPQSGVDQGTGLPKNLGSTFNMYGTINLGSANAVDRFFERLDRQKEMAAYGVGV